MLSRIIIGLVLVLTMYFVVIAPSVETIENLSETISIIGTEQ